MKKFATLAVLAAISGGAYAQSSVTLFGILDANARYVKNEADTATGATNSASLKSLGSGGLNTSRLGFRGVEDLGSGLKASFWLETGINVDSGISSDTGRFFNRRATVSLLGNFGELRLGRDFTPTYTGYSEYDPFGDSGIAASGKFDSSLGTARDTGTRADNQIMYLLPSNLGGVYGRAAVAAGEGVAGKKYIGGRIGYAAGPFDVSVNYGQTEVAPVLGDDDFTVAGAGASYDFGVVKFLAYASQNEFVNQKLLRYQLGAIAPVGQGQIKINYTHVNAKGRTPLNASVDANDAKQLGVGYVYNLSKRTALYGTAVYVKNDAAAAFVATGGPTVAGTRDRKSTGAELGVRHSF